MLMNPERDYSQYRETKTVGLGYQVIIVLMLLLSLVMLVCSATFLAFPETESMTNDLPEGWVEPPVSDGFRQEATYSVVDVTQTENTESNLPNNYIEPPTGYENAQKPTYEVVDLRNNEQSSSNYITAEEMEGLVPPPGGW